MIALSAALAGWESAGASSTPTRSTTFRGWWPPGSSASSGRVGGGLPHQGRPQDQLGRYRRRWSPRPDRWLTSLAVVIGALGVAAGWQLPTPSGLLITVAILFVLKDAGRDIYRRLMDSVDPGLVDDVLRVLAAVPGVQVVESVRIRWIGHGLRAEAEVISDADLTLAEAHAIAEEGHHRLLHEIRRLEKVTIHSSLADMTDEITIPRLLTTFRHQRRHAFPVSWRPDTDYYGFEPEPASADLVTIIRLISGTKADPVSRATDAGENDVDVLVSAVLVSLASGRPQRSSNLVLRSRIPMAEFESRVVVPAATRRPAGKWPNCRHRRAARPGHRGRRPRPGWASSWPGRSARSGRSGGPDGGG